MHKPKFTGIVFAMVLLMGSAVAGPEEAAQGLLERVVPERADGFRFEALDSEDGLDVFEIESAGEKVVLRGNTGVAMASALNWYLKHYCNAHYSLQGSQLALPDPLPEVSPKVRIETPFRYRYCFNYCCFSYSLAWYDWADWEHIIDWMALHGINAPLAVTGQEGVWQEVYRGLGLTDEEIGAFIVGPAYLPFGWMGCMDGWGGPLTQDWIDRHCELQEKILARERSLGMKPVLQGFTGHVPHALQDKFPEAQFQQLPSWCGFPGTLFVEPGDPLFQTVGKAFVEEQTRQFGTDHLYASDTFIEMSPPSDKPEFLTKMGGAIYGAMTAADPEAHWLLQGWLFVNNPGFWKEPQAKALLRSAPEGRMILLDLWGEARPAWRKTDCFYGNPWVWCILQNFGDQVSLHGGLPQIADGLSSVHSYMGKRALSGAGFIMEGLGNNPVVYDLMADMMWQPKRPKLEEWIGEFAVRRYGKPSGAAENAWLGLLRTAYRTQYQSNSILCARPALSGRGHHAGGQTPYPARELAAAWGSLLECAPAFSGVSPYAFDVVHVTRQVLANLAQEVHGQLLTAFRDGDRPAFLDARDRFLALLRETDALLGTREEFLLGRWLSDAKRWAANEEESAHYEWNARNQITLWGPEKSTLHDYAAKQWGGLMRGFYLPRWEQFFEELEHCLAEGTKFDRKAFERQMQAWEVQWTHGREVYPDRPQGDGVAMAKGLFEKYSKAVLTVEAPSLTTGKPVICSHALPQFPAYLANDGCRSSTDSYWATDVRKDPYCWWQVDLEKAERLARVELVFYFGDQRSYGFTLETSLDGKAWHLVDDIGEDYVEATAGGVLCEFEPRLARYLRVTVTHNTANTGRHLVEVLAFGP